MFIHTEESIQEFEDYLRKLEEEVGLTPKTAIEIYKAINLLKNKKKMNLPENIKLNGYGETIKFQLTDKREIKYYGKTKTSNESMWRSDKLKVNEVFYQTEWGWGVFVDVDLMETVSFDGTEWGGQKITN